MERGRYSIITASLNANGDTTIATPGAGQSIYVLYVSVDVTVVGTTSTSQLKDNATPFATFLTTAVGHQEANYATGIKDYSGFKLTQDAPLVLTKAGGAAATERVTVLIEIR